MTAAFTEQQIRATTHQAAVLQFVDWWRNRLDRVLGARLTVRGWDLSYPPEVDR